MRLKTASCTRCWRDIQVPPSNRLRTYLLLCGDCYMDQLRLHYADPRLN